MNEWRDIESAPKDGTQILVWFQAGDEQPQQVVMSWSDRAADDYKWLCVEHHWHRDVARMWRPLPAPPLTTAPAPASQPDTPAK